MPRTKGATDLKPRRRRAALSEEECIQFGRRLSMLRRWRGLGRKELGDQAGFYFGYVTNYECGQYAPTPARLRIIAKVLGTTTDALLGKEPLEVMLCPHCVGEGLVPNTRKA